MADALHAATYLGHVIKEYAALVQRGAGSLYHLMVFVPFVGKVPSLIQEGKVNKTIAKSINLQPQ